MNLGGIYSSIFPSQDLISICDTAYHLRQHNPMVRSIQEFSPARSILCISPQSLSISALIMANPDSYFSENIVAQIWFYALNFLPCVSPLYKSYPLTTVLPPAPLIALSVMGAQTYPLIPTIFPLVIYGLI